MLLVVNPFPIRPELGLACSRAVIAETVENVIVVVYSCGWIREVGAFSEQVAQMVQKYNFRLVLELEMRSGRAHHIEAEAACTKRTKIEKGLG